MPQDTQTPKTDIKFSGDVIVKEISIRSFGSSDENLFDISALVREFNIYENIFENCLSADLIIADGLDLVNKFPIIGQEVVKIVYGLFSDSSADVTQYFSVYKVSDRYSDDTDLTQVYKLNCCSIPYLRNTVNTVQKSFRGTHREIVDEIYRDYLFSPSYPKKLKYSETLLQDRFVSPNWTPLRCINYLSGKAQNKNNADDCTFLFWEGLNQFNFTSLSSLMQKEAKWTLARFPANQYDPQTKEKNAAIPFFTIESISLNETYNRLVQLRNGTLASKLQTYDPVTRTYNVTNYSYNRDFDTTEHLNKYPLLPNRTDLFSTKINSHIQFHPLSTHRNDEDLEDFVTDQLLSRNAKITELMSFSAFCTIPGNTYLSAGDVVEVLYTQKSPSTENKKLSDEYLSGRWIVGSIKHSVTTNSDYRMFLTLYKESSAEPYPDVVKA